MVVEKGGQNCIHLREFLSQPFALCVRREPWRETEEKGRQESAQVGASASHFPRRRSPALHPRVCQRTLTVPLARFQSAVTKWTTLYTVINMLSPSH